MTKHFTFENDFVSSYAALIYHRPTEYGIVAEEDCHILVVDSETYVKQINTETRWGKVARHYSEHIYNLKELREASFLLMDAKTRYENFLVQYPGAQKRIKQKTYCHLPWD